MRGVLFPEVSKELQEYIETHETEENQYLAEDYKLLKQHYSIVLEYVKELEDKIRVKNKEINNLKNKLLNMGKQEEDNVVFDKSTDATIRSLNRTIAGLKSNNAREKKKREELEKLLVESVKELNELRGFKNKMVNILNKGE